MWEERAVVSSPVYQVTGQQHELTNWKNVFDFINMCTEVSLSLPPLTLRVYMLWLIGVDQWIKYINTEREIMSSMK